MTPDVYAYIRFSSSEQSEGDSYRRQRELIDNYLYRERLTIAEKNIFFDAGKSAFKGKHLEEDGELRRFLNLVEAGRVKKGSLLLVENADRFSRQFGFDAVGQLLSLVRAGVIVVTLSPETRYDNPSDFYSFLQPLFEFNRANEESKKKSERLEKVWRQKQKLAAEKLKPISSICPQWLKLENGKYRPIADRVKTIKKIYKLTIDGYGAGLICKKLNEEDVPVFGSPRRNIRMIWAESSVKKILNSRAVLGEYLPHFFNNETKKREPLEPIPGYYPKIVSEEIFYQAQAAIAQRKVSKATKQSREFNVWQGVAFCALCGDALHKINKGASPKGGTYLVCYSAKRGKCTYQSLRLSIAEQLFKEVLLKVDSLSLVQSNEASLNRELAQVQTKLQEINTLLQRQSKLLDTSPSETLAKKIRENEALLKEHKNKEKELLEKLSTDKIIDREKFLSKLDLRSREGRSRANSLLKRLHAKALFHPMKMNRETLVEIADFIGGTDHSDQELKQISAYAPMWRIVLKVEDKETFTFSINGNNEISSFASTPKGFITQILQDESIFGKLNTKERKRVLDNQPKLLKKLNEIYKA